MTKGWLFLCILFSHQSTAQQNTNNLIPNPGFEEFDRTPIGWFYNGNHFTKLVQFWSSPTEASPDAYGPEIYVPRHWQDKGFGKMKPYEGSAMAGITLYGCNLGKPHCREYLQIQLSEPIIPGQKYRFSLYAASLPQSTLANNLGIAFTDNPLKVYIDTCLDLKPTVFSGDVFPSSRHNWEKLTMEFTGNRDYGNIIIGNFFIDSETKVEKQPDNLNFVYYYIDQVSLVKLPPILPQPIAKDDFTRKNFKKGMVINLEEIFFDVDQVYLHPRSVMELDKLYSILIKYPSMKIKIIGHTDNSGSKEYNMELSIRRAEEVVKYLNQKGIALERLSSEGVGDSNPILSNKNDSGRRRNRRVEFEVLAL